MGLKVGDKIPFFTLPDSEGKPLLFISILKTTRLVVLRKPVIFEIVTRILKS
jgi:peroxiredoxin